VSEAALIAGIGRKTHYRRLERDPPEGTSLKVNFSPYN
jgi:hypothetical protein